jgi:hypothetical protein
LANPKVLFKLVFLFCAVALYWSISDGNWKFWEPQWFTSYYDAVAERLVHGRLDLPADDLDHEVFRHNGKTYGYFGPTPALPRIVLNQIFPAERGRWTRTSIWCVSVATLALCVALLAYCGIPLGSSLALAYVVTVTLGSSLLFGSSWAITYMEALDWGVCLALASLYCLMRYVRAPETRWMVLAGVAGGLSFFSRNATGTGPLFALGLITVALLFRPGLLSSTGTDEYASGRQRFVHATIGASALALCAVTLAVINYAKFGSPFESYPIRLHAFYTPAQLEKIHNTLIHPGQAPRRLFDYLFGAIAFHRSFPWFTFSDHNVIPIRWLLPDALYSGAEGHAGVLLTMPALFLLAFLGITVGLRGDPHRLPLQIILISPLIGVFTLASIAWISQRYVPEFFPFVAVSAPFGLRWLINRRRDALRWSGIALVSVLMAWSIVVNPVLAIYWQRGGPTWGCTQACADQYQRIRTRMDSIFHVNRRGR